MLLYSNEMFSNIFAICTKQVVFHAVSYEVSFSLMISVVNRYALTAVVAVFCFLKYLIVAIFKSFFVIHVSSLDVLRNYVFLTLKTGPR